MRKNCLDQIEWISIKGTSAGSTSIEKEPITILFKPRYLLLQPSLEARSAEGRNYARFSSSHLRRNGSWKHFATGGHVHGHQGSGSDGRSGHEKASTTFVFLFRIRSQKGAGPSPTLSSASYCVNGGQDPVARKLKQKRLRGKGSQNTFLAFSSSFYLNFKGPSRTFTNVKGLPSQFYNSVGLFFKFKRRCCNSFYHT